MGISTAVPAGLRTLNWQTPPGPSPLIKRDLFPAAVSLAPTRQLTAQDPPNLHGLPPDPAAPTHAKSRTILTTDSVFIFIDTPGGPDLLFTARLDAVDGDYSTGYDLTYTSAHPDTPQTPAYRTTLQVRPTGGCGCGSRLNSLRPWSQMRYTAATR